MKFKKIIAAIAATVFATIAANQGKAIPISYFTNAVTISATAITQEGTNTTSTTTTVSTGKVSVTTKQLLAWLAKDEKVEGNYPAGTNFPAGAQLLLLVPNFGTGADFRVV